MNEAIPAILFDVDGVLTDGKLNITADGQKMFKSFHTRDIRALRELVQRGHEVCLVTADEWDGSRLFAEKVGAGWWAAKDKSTISEHFPQGFYYIGDDAFDVRVMELSKRLFAPCDADLSAASVEDVEILRTPGGGGVAAEILQILYYPDLLGHNK